MHGQDFHDYAILHGLKTEHDEPGVVILIHDHHQVCMATEIFGNKAILIFEKTPGDDFFQAQRHVVAVGIEHAFAATMIHCVIRLSVLRALGENMAGELYLHSQIEIRIVTFALNWHVKRVQMGHVV